LKDFGFFFRGFFEDSGLFFLFCFCMVKYLSFHNSSFFLKILVHVNGKATVVVRHTCCEVFEIQKLREFVCYEDEFEFMNKKKKKKKKKTWGVVVVHLQRKKERRALQHQVYIKSSVVAICDLTSTWTDFT